MVKPKVVTSGQDRSASCLTTDLTINPTFPTITVGDPPTTPLTPDVIEDLSADQYYAYNIAQAIRSGNLPGDLAVLEIGPVNHARW